MDEDNKSAAAEAASEPVAGAASEPEKAETAAVEAAADSAVGETVFPTAGERLTGIILLLPAVILIGAGVRMFFLTLGTKLLYTSASAGRIYRCYWLFLLLGVVYGIVIFALRHKKIKAVFAPFPEKKSKVRADKRPAEAVGNKSGEKAVELTVREGYIKCPGCGTEFKSGAKFCNRCGRKL